MNSFSGTTPSIFVCISLVTVAALLPAQDWPNWRGPAHNGSSNCEGLPETFSKTENVRWSVGLPGPGASTPIVFGTHIFLSSVDAERSRLVAMCVDRKAGKIVWQKDAGSGYQPGGTGKRTGRGFRRSSYASPSPVSDGKTVVFFFGNGDLAAYDFKGKKLWSRNVQKDYGDFSFQWTFSASPTFWEGKVFLPVLQRDTKTHKLGGLPASKGQDSADAGKQGIESFILALDPQTGKTLYRHIRPSDARKESLESYTTMIPHVGEGGRKELLLAGGDVITGHDPATGKELWRWGTWNEGNREVWWRLVPSVVTGDGVALVCSPKRQPVYAVKLAGNEGELGDAGLLWKSGGRPNKLSSDVPTPAFDGKHFFVLSDVREAISKIVPKTGKIEWSTSLPKIKWRSSPTVADGRVYLLSHHGDVVVLDAVSGKIVHRTKMGNEDDDQIRSSVVAAHSNLFIRTNDRLYCLGN